jgi:hypothetical protein
MVELLAEVLFGTIGEALLEGLIRLIGASFGSRGREHPVAAALGLLLLGAIAGGASALAWPYQIVGNGPFPGISLIVSPLVNGAIWEGVGRLRDRRGRPRTYLSTFWGAALFAFATAAARFWLVGGR